MTEQTFNIVPYGENDGVRTMSDSFVAGLYLRMQAEGSGRWAFVGGPVQAPSDFVRHMKEGNRLFVVVQDQRPLGLFWLNNMEQRSCRVHFCVFKEAFGQQATAMGRAVLAYLLQTRAKDGQYLFDCVLGVVPEHNALARRFAVRVGMKRAGKIPGMLFDHHLGRSFAACLHYATREG